MMCPCNIGRLGAFTVMVCLVWPIEFGGGIGGGIPAMINLALAGNFSAIGWAVAAVFGLGWLCIGIREALTHDDDFNLGSVVFSAAVIGLAVYAMRNGWYLRGDALLFHLSRAFWWGLIGSEAFNLWLNFRGRRHAARVVPQPVVPQERQPPRLRRGLRVTKEWVEEIEGHGLHQLPPGYDHHSAPAHIASAVGYDGDAPQIVYVKDRQGNFIPVGQLPDAVPVNRRLR